jgi:carboxypeptidase Q
MSAMNSNSHRPRTLIDPSGSRRRSGIAIWVLATLLGCVCTVALVIVRSATYARTSANASQAEAPAAEPACAEFAAAIERIWNHARTHDGGWNKLTELCDDIGHRLSGSEGLERAVQWAAETMKRDGHENVRLEPVTVPKWVRGAESAELISPRKLKLHVMGLGGSIGTPPEGIEAEVLVVRNEAELKARSDEARGRIVLFAYPMQQYDPARGTGYGDAVRFRVFGARWAAAYGAKAAMVRSVTARSLRSPHTGAMSYNEAPLHIPGAALSTEDADMLARFEARGIRPVIRLRMEARNAGDAQSANVVGEIVGREKPEEIVVIGGHIDSWDVGQGAHDDGGGCISAMHALTMLRELGLRPRRTIRVVLWTNEENGLAGGKQYAVDHAGELANHVAAIEMDSGVFQPMGFGIEMEDAAKAAIAAKQLEPLAALLRDVGATQVKTGFSGADVSPMKPAGVALMGLDVDNSTYFDYHHTEADTLDKVDPDNLKRTSAALAMMAYMLAEMPGRLGE